MASYTYLSIDKLIEHGRPFPHWRNLCRAAIEDPTLLGKVEQISRWCSVDTEIGQRYQRWNRWCKKQRAIDELEERFRLLALARERLGGL